MMFPFCNCVALPTAVELDAVPVQFLGKECGLSFQCSS